MVTSPSPLEHACTRQCRPPRHSHAVPQLGAAGLICPCGGTCWRVLYGGALPIGLACDDCLRSYPLEQLLRRRPGPAGGF